MITMMVGYAIFSETITINGTATAKGEFSIETTCTTGIDSKFTSIEGFEFDSEHGYKNDGCTVSGNTVKLNVEFDYPTARRYFTVKMTNNGTIGASLDIADYVDGFTQSGKSCYDINSDGKMSEDECFDVGSFNGRTDVYSIDSLVFERVDKTLALTEEEQAEFIDSETSIVKLKPGESFYLFLKSYAHDISSDNSYFMTSDVSYSFNWKQITN